jgi:hypothetical protein
MDAEKRMSDDRSHELREQIHQTQTDLGLKIGALEGEVRAVATHARDAVRERVAAVRNTIDVRQVLGRRPLASCVVAFGVGVLLGSGARPKPFSQARRHGVLGGGADGGFRSMVAPEVGALRAMIAGKAIAVLGDALRKRFRGE